MTKCCIGQAFEAKFQQLSDGHPFALAVHEGRVLTLNLSLGMVVCRHLANWLLRAGWGQYHGRLPARMVNDLGDLN